VALTRTATGTYTWQVFVVGIRASSWYSVTAKDDNVWCMVNSSEASAGLETCCAIVCTAKEAVNDVVHSKLNA
jgi:hypothetical protein